MSDQVFMSSDPFKDAYPNESGAPSCRGLSTREYFAVRLMAARIAADPDDLMSRELQANMAVKDADALIAALNAKGDQA